eukprot:m.183549 g.183549  ORF g.183549 m.183549 type:complete len:503 (+) comp15842_c0_seq1:152-1660(+)
MAQCNPWTRSAQSAAARQHIHELHTRLRAINHDLSEGCAAVQEVKLALKDNTQARNDAVYRAAEQRVSKHNAKLTRHQLRQAEADMGIGLQEYTNSENVLRDTLQKLETKVLTQSEERKEVMRLLDDAVARPVSNGCDPTLWLPDELIAHIFLAAPFSLLWDGTLARVCQRWHRVAQSAVVQRRLREGRWSAYQHQWIQPRRIPLQYIEDEDGGVKFVYAMAIGPGNRLYVALNKDVHVYNLTTGVHIHQLVGHQAMVRSVVVGEDSRVYTGSWDSTVRVWNTHDAKECERFSFGDWVTALALWTDCGIAVGQFGGDIVVTRGVGKTMESPEDNVLCVLKGHTRIVVALVVQKKDNILISASHDNTIRLWLPASCHTASLSATSSSTWTVGFAVRSLTLSPDGLTLFSGSSDDTIRVWSMKDGSVRQTLPTSDDVLGLSCTHDGRQLCAGTLDDVLTMYSKASDSSWKKVFSCRDVECGIVKHTDSGHLVTTSLTCASVCVW